MNNFWFWFCKPLAELALACLLCAGLMFLMFVGAMLRLVSDWYHKTFRRFR